MGFSQAMWPRHINKVYLSIYISFNFNHDTLDDTKIAILKKCIVHWKQSLCNSQKTRIYNTFEDIYTPSPYLDLTRKNPDRKTLVKLRINNHKLLIETGRYISLFVGIM